MKKRFLRIVLFGALGLTLLCSAVVGASAMSNRNLPTHSQVTDQLSDLEKARLAEAIHLRQTLGDTAWLGWGLLDVPIIVYNEEYAFLVGYSSPPAGWVKMPQNEPRGGPWEAVPDDTFESQVYYRQRLAGTTPGYTALPALTADPDFREYTTREQYWSGQLDEARRTTGREGETRFYYSGMAQAVLLDRLLPDWKEWVFNPDVMLEDLLRQATEQP